MADAKIYLFDSPSRQMKDGRFPISLRVSHDRQRKYFKTKYAAFPEQWDKATGRFKAAARSEKFKTENADLTAIEAKAQRIIRKFEDDDTPFSFEKFSALFAKKDRSKLVDYFAQKIDRLNREGRPSTAAPFQQALSAISRFKGSDVNRLRLHDVDSKFLEDFESYLRAERKLKDTSISVYMRALRTILNTAIKDRILQRDHRPFEDYHISKLSTDTAKRAISRDTVKAIEALDLSDKPALQLARDLFIFSYYTRGMNFVDVALLTPGNISGERIEYTRSKTGKLFSVKLLPPAKAILERYRDQGSGYLFPIFDDTRHKTEAQLFNRRKTALRDINRGLKEIARMVGMEGLRLTSYVARHTYAQVLKESGVNLSVISEALGHQSEGITRIYLKSFGDDVLDSTDENVL